jgi:hypothetical protein
MIKSDENGKIYYEAEWDINPYGIFSLSKENQKLKEKIKRLTKTIKKLKGKNDET